jgi:nucleotide sugar dehydrogenase
MSEKKDSLHNALDPEVVVIGVGFVGLTLAMSLCQKGIKVLGIDSNLNLVSELSRGETNIVEDGLVDLLQSSLRNGLFEIQGTQIALKRSERPITFIVTVGTPLKNGGIDQLSVEQSLLQIGSNLLEGDLLILRSTLAIGTCRELVKPFLDKLERKVYLAMCPERTIEGNALAEIDNLPQVIGGIDEQSTERAKEFFSKICNKIVLVSSIEAAELLKLANNTFRDLMFAFSNEIAMLSQQIGLSAKEVIQAANFEYPRSRIALPGPSGGPCLEKDPWILYHSGQRFGVEMLLSGSSRRVNESAPYRYVIEIISELTTRREKLRVGLLGLSFKGNPPVNDTRGSFAIELLKRLDNYNIEFYGFEPAGQIQTKVARLNLKEDIFELFENSDVVVIATNHLEFQHLERALNQINSERSMTLIDMWNIVDRKTLPEFIDYRSWG